MTRPNRHTTLARRNFLKLTMVSLSAPVVLGTNSTAWAMVSRAWNKTPLLEPPSVGYWLGSEDLSLFESTVDGVETLSLDVDDVSLGRVAKGARLSRHLIAAERLIAGDPLLAEWGTKLTIHGMIGAHHEWPQGGPRAFNLFVNFKAGAAASEIFPWQAWTLERSPVLNVSSPVSSVVPVDRSGLELVAELVFTADCREGRSPASHTGPCKQVPIVLTVGDEPRKAKLRRGVYFIAVHERPGQLPPSWHRRLLTARDTPDEPTEELALEFQRSAFAKPDHKHLVLSVDYAHKG